MSDVERMLRLSQVERMTGRKKTWIYAEVAHGRFPPSDDGLWYLSEVMDYLRRRREGRVPGTPRAERRAAA